MQSYKNPFLLADVYYDNDANSDSYSDKYDEDSSDDDTSVSDSNVENNNKNNNNNMKFKHGFSVEDIAILSNGFSFVSVGDKWAKLWDIRNNNEPILSSQTN